MVTINGIGNIADTAPVRQVRGRGRGSDAATTAASDGLQISPEAREAAEVAHYIEVSKQQEELRMAKVQEARQRIEEGAHKVQETVLQVSLQMLPMLQS